MHVSQGIIRVFFRVLLVGLVFLGRVQQELQKSKSTVILLTLLILPEKPNIHANLSSEFSKRSPKALPPVNPPPLAPQLI